MKLLRSLLVLKKYFSILFISFFINTSSWSKGMEIEPYDLFYLSFTPALNFFTIDTNGQDFLQKINPPRIMKEIDRLAILSQSLIAQMGSLPPSVLTQMKDTLEQNQLSAVEADYQTACSGLAQQSFLLTPLSDDHLKLFRNGTYNNVFNHPQLDRRVHNAIEKVIKFGFLPFEREIIFSQQEMLVLHILGLDNFFEIDDHIKEYSQIRSKIHSLLYGSIVCKKLAEWDEDDKRFWVDKRKIVSVFDRLPYYQRAERTKGDSQPLYHPKSEVSQFREIFIEAKKTYEEIKKSLSIEDIDREIGTLVERHAAGLGNTARAMLGLPPKKQYDWQFYPAYEKLSHFQRCIETVIQALKLASSAQEDFNREGPALRGGVVCVDVLAQSCNYRVKVKAQSYSLILKELEYLIRIPYMFDHPTSKLLKRIYLTYEDDPVKIFYWNGYLTH
jgi:hypothetical protein